MNALAARRRIDHSSNDEPIGQIALHKSSERLAEPNLVPRRRRRDRRGPQRRDVLARIADEIEPDPDVDVGQLRGQARQERHEPECRVDGLAPSVVDAARVAGRLVDLPSSRAEQERLGEADLLHVRRGCCDGPLTSRSRAVNDHHEDGACLAISLDHVVTPG